MAQCGYDSRPPLGRDSISFGGTNSSGRNDKESHREVTNRSFGRDLKLQSRQLQSLPPMFYPIFAHR